MKKYMVFWIRNRRIGSLQLTFANWMACQKRMHLTLIQKDITGTLHYEINQLRKEESK